MSIMIMLQLLREFPEFPQYHPYGVRGVLLGSMVHNQLLCTKRNRQIAKDLAYIEDRKPWQIIEDALEEYVVRHYGKEYKRK